MRKIRTFYYILRQGMANSFKNWHMLFSSIFVIFVSLYIMGCLVMLSVNLQRILMDLTEQQKEVLIDCSTEISDAASYSIADIIYTLIRGSQFSKERPGNSGRMPSMVLPTALSKFLTV